jgi:hypothetical protein
MKKYICKRCGFVTNDKSKPHECAMLETQIHYHDGFAPRSEVDAMIQRLIGHIKTELKTFVEHHPHEAEKIHPRFLVSLTITNVLLNLFTEVFDCANCPVEAMREGFMAMLSSINEMSMNGLNALITASADTSSMN